MPNALDALLGRISDQALRLAVQDEVMKLRNTKEFGLVFERHLPERVRLLTHPIQVGSSVEMRARPDGHTWFVSDIDSDSLTLIDVDGNASISSIDDVVVVKTFGDPVYPGLVPSGSVSRGGEKAPHLVVNGENYHALETLLYSLEGSVDVIYIDPPYNSGAKDWKYNNDYVDNEDSFRHSKWLSFIEKRLRLAKRLLKAERSVLIFTIDEREYLTAGLLLKQVFPDASIQMVSTLTNPKGVSRGVGFRRADEYIYFVMIGEATPARLALSDEWSAKGAELEADAPETEETQQESQEVESKPLTPSWTSMMRRGSGAARSDRMSMFYPIYADPSTRRVVDVGPPLPADEHEAPPREGLVAILPMRKNGSEGRWQVGATEFISRLGQGRVRLGRQTSYGYVVNYLPDGEYAEVMSGAFEITGHADDGSIIAVRTGTDPAKKIALSQWRIRSHNASEHGSTLLTAFIPRRKFPFPKSLYAVEDALRFFVAEDPNALVVDFFAGSGTTAHALMRLNKQDGGRRRCILVTNNEVSIDEQASLLDKGLSPGDEDWEAVGICEFITKPRVRAAIEGLTPEGKPVEGSYSFVDQFPMSDGFQENALFFNLAYLARDSVERGREFELIAPLLWLQAGGVGPLIGSESHDFTVLDNGKYGVLFDASHWRMFAEKLSACGTATHAFIVTDSRATYQQVVRALPPSIKTRMLYENYLTNFEINMGGLE